MTLLELLDRPIAFQRSFVSITGSINAALFLSQVLYWSNRTDPSGWFYKTQVDWQEETGLTRREQETARKCLVELGLLYEERKGIPAKMYFRLNREVLHSLLANAPSRLPSMALNAKLDARETPERPVQTIQSITETTQRPLHENPIKAPAGAGRVTSQVTKSEGFEVFWTLYPKRLKKGDALKAWEKLGCSKIIDTILFAVGEHIQTEQWSKQKGRFIPYPASWLNSKRWEDEIEAKDGKKQTPTGDIF